MSHQISMTCRMPIMSQYYLTHQASGWACTVNTPLSNGSCIYFIRSWRHSYIKWSTCISSHSCYTSLSLQPASKASWGVPNDQLTEGERTQAGLQMLLHGMQVPPESGQAAVLQPCSGTSLEDSDEGNPTEGRTSSTALGCSLYLEEKMGWCAIFYWYLGHGQWFAISPITRFHGSRNQEMEIELIPLIITPSDSLATFCFLFPWLHVLLA